jgi:hypothetical protein
MSAKGKRLSMKHCLPTGMILLSLVLPCWVQAAKATRARTTAGVSSSLGSGVVQYARSHLGQKIGNGECWTLADQALRAAGAKRPGREGMATYVFGRRLGPREALRPGDVLQFEKVRFEHKNQGGGSSWVDMPHHTAIVGQVRGRVVTIYQQNFGSTAAQKRVRTDTINLAERVRGTVTAYRPIPR